ncbi:MAG: hypothetical protein NC102_06800 [Clostridium sp.]|nr:hypothetical protein [Clostridium sp.]
MSFFYSVEFYVILAVVAAAIVALASRPAQNGPVEEILISCLIEDASSPQTRSLAADSLTSATLPVDHPKAALRMQCLDSGRIAITRFGLANLCGDGAVSLAIQVKGADIRIEERLTPGKGLLLPLATASCVLPFIKLDRYHVAYNSASTGLFASFTFPAKPGMVVDANLRM